MQQTTLMCLNWQTHISFLEKDFKAHKPNIPPHAFLFCLADHVGSLQIGHISAINIYPLSVG